MVRGSWRASVHGVARESDTIECQAGTHAWDHEGRVTDISFCSLALTKVESHDRRAVAGIWGDCGQLCPSTWEMHKHGRPQSPLRVKRRVWASSRHGGSWWLVQHHACLQVPWPGLALTPLHVPLLDSEMPGEGCRVGTGLV